MLGSSHWLCQWSFFCDGAPGLGSEFAHEKYGDFGLQCFPRRHKRSKWLRNEDRNSSLSSFDTKWIIRFSLSRQETGLVSLRLVALDLEPFE